MKRFTFSIIALMTLPIMAFSQNITPEVLQTLKASYQDTPQDKAIRNAIGSTDITKLARNQENLNALDYHFTYRVPNKGITDQMRSGRCWMFCGLNVLRADVLKRFDIKELEFSECYLFFYDQLEKANFFLENIIATRKLPADDKKVEYLLHNPIGDGGSYTGVADLINKYGLVPAEAMHETMVSNNTASYRTHIQIKLRECALKLRNAKGSEQAIRQMKEQQLKEVYRMLVLCFGTPPEQFVWNQYGAKDTLISSETYTPKQFAEKFIRPEMINGYIMFMNDPSREYYKVYDVDLDRHIVEGQNWCYINLPIEDMQQIAIASLKDSVAMYTGSDVNKFRDGERGYLSLQNYDFQSLWGMDFPMTKSERIQTYASGSAHAMSLVGVDLDADGKPVKWLLENSWGDKAGWKGHLLLTDEWFHEYMFRLVVEAKYVPENIKSLLDTKHIQLPAWDPMAQGEED